MYSQIIVDGNRARPCHVHAYLSTSVMSNVRAECVLRYQSLISKIVGDSGQHGTR